MEGDSAVDDAEHKVPSPEPEDNKEVCIVVPCFPYLSLLSLPRCTALMQIPVLVMLSQNFTRLT